MRPKQSLRQAQDKSQIKIDKIYRMNSSPPSSRITYICLTASIGGLLFGFDTAVISGTISFVKAQFALTPPEGGLFGRSGLLGCILGVILTSFLSDRLGRKKVMMLSAFMFL